MIALLVAAPVAFAEPGQNGPPGPEGNPNQETTPAPPAQGPPTTPPGNSGSNPHGGPPGITGQPPQTPAAPSRGQSQSGGGQPATPAAPAAQGASQGTPPAATPAAPATPQGPPAGLPHGNGNPGGQGPGAGNGGGPDGRITICHATGSATNPYVEITISVNGLNGHGGHHDGADIIPAPAGGCEMTSVAAPVEIVPAGAGTRGAWPAGEPAGEAPQGGVLGEAQFGETGLEGSSETDGEQVLAADVTGAAAADGEGTGEASEGGELPFTGLAIGGLLIAASLMLASGFGLRLGTRESSQSSD